MGALCYYGLGLSSRPGALEISQLVTLSINIYGRIHFLLQIVLSFFSFWPEHVKARIKDTYIYFGSSIAVSAASAMAIFRSPTIMNIVTRSGWMVNIVSYETSSS